MRQAQPIVHLGGYTSTVIRLDGRNDRKCYEHGVLVVLFFVCPHHFWGFFFY
jgi:hypothetical protein